MIVSFITPRTNWITWLKGTHFSKQTQLSVLETVRLDVLFSQTIVWEKLNDSSCTKLNLDYTAYSNAGFELTPALIKTERYVRLIKHAICLF